MIDIKDFIRLHLNVTWTLLKTCLYYNINGSSSIDSISIIDYACDRLIAGDNGNDVAMLAGLNKYDTQSIGNLLNKLASGEPLDDYNEYRKLRLTYVIKSMPSLNGDFMDGLIKLADIWNEFDLFDGCPFYYQGSSNNITPEIYYTRQNYEKLLKAHYVWINKELDDLRVAN
jgi:hypothetical protein